MSGRVRGSVRAQQKNESAEARTAQLSALPRCLCVCVLLTSIAVLRSNCSGGAVT